MEVIASKPATATGLRTPMRLGTASVGPRNWHDDTAKTIRLNAEIIKKSEKEKEYGRQHDPLPLLRDSLSDQSNTVALGYMREVRAVAFKFREVLLAVNEELKMVIRTKEQLERTLDYVRKDIHINKKSIEIRTQRPKREKDSDKADNLLDVERQVLNQCKKDTEEKIGECRRTLMMLNHSRKRLAALLQERSQVLDLVCHSKGSTKFDYRARLPSPSGRVETMRPMTHAGTNSARYDDSMINDILARTSGLKDEAKGTNGLIRDQMKSGVYTARTLYGTGDRPSTPPVNPLGPYTPECATSLDEAMELIKSARQLRSDSALSMEDTDMKQKKWHHSVNDGLTQRLAETVTLLQHLNMGEAENRNALNRATRHYHMTDMSRGYNLGPDSYRDLRTHEHLDRPIMKFFQRHPGTNFPDAADLIKANNLLETSLAKTNKNIALLHLSQMRMKDDEKDKRAAADIDASILRFRKKRHDHRWTMEECK